MRASSTPSKAMNSVVESTQLWWSVRPHHAFGTVEVRICDAQPTARESTALAALMVAVTAQTALDLDAGRMDGQRPLRDREIEENLWRAIRYGMDGKLIDFRGGREVETVRALEQMLEWTSEAREGLGLEVDLPDKNGAQRARQAIVEGATVEDVYRNMTAEVESTFAPMASGTDA